MKAIEADNIEKLKLMENHLGLLEHELGIAKVKRDEAYKQCVEDKRCDDAGKPDGQTKSPRIQANDPLEKQQRAGHGSGGEAASGGLRH